MAKEPEPIERRIGYTEMHDDIKEIKQILLGKEGNNGLVGKVNAHDRYIGSQIRFGWVVLTSFVGSIVIIIVGFFNSHKS